MAQATVAAVVCVKVDPLIGRRCVMPSRPTIYNHYNDNFQLITLTPPGIIKLRNSLSVLNYP